VARIETRFGVAPALGTSYTQLGSDVPSNKRWNVLLNICNITSSAATFRAYIADTSWTTGEPSGGTLIAPVALDVVIGPADVVQIGGIILHETDALVVRAGTESSLSVIAQGTEADET
jgi:hypothetical protein